METCTEYQRIPEPKHPLVEEVYLRSWEDRKRFLESLHLSKTGYFMDRMPKTIIDVACGCGASSYAYARTFPKADVIGIDISEKAIEIAKRNYQVKNLSFSVEDASDLEKYRGQADIVICFSSMHEFEDLEACLRQIYLVLKKEGILHFSDINRNDIPNLTPDSTPDENTQYEVGDKFYQLRASLSDEDFIALLQDEKGLADLFGEGTFEENQWELIKFSSYAAAYTPEEITCALQMGGFCDIHWMDPIGFQGYAVKHVDI
jgi:2-polyprenyl-3-methyl-5-hydroxy-6-metoxy-1,4-benzoquinol methylase